MRFGTFVQGRAVGAKRLWPGLGSSKLASYSDYELRDCDRCILLTYSQITNEVSNRATPYVPSLLPLAHYSLTA
jgi:hypothetical protein